MWLRLLFQRYYRTSLLVLILCGAHAAVASPSDDYSELVQLTHQYAWGIDTMDKEILTSVFTSDASAHYIEVGSNHYGLDVKLESFEKIYEWLSKYLKPRKGHAGLPGHFMSNHLIEISGDTATMTYYMHNRSMAAGGVYYTEAERTASGWRIKSLRLEEQFWNIDHYKDKSGSGTAEK